MVAGPLDYQIEDEEFDAALNKHEDKQLALDIDNILNDVLNSERLP